ncbi:MAG: homocysteine S-methyltransferase family protein [bacterium]
MKYSFLEVLKERILVFDGAMGTMLMEYGLTAGSCPEEWNLLKPEVVEEVHRLYLEAGANCIETNTFGANRIRLSSYRLEDRVRDINLEGARLARKVAGDNAFVAGSIGPTGKMLYPLGDLTFESAYNAFKEQALALEAGGVDAIIIETMTDLQEARIALLACKENISLPVICQMSFDENLRTVTGTPPEVAALVLWSLGADVVGANCSMGSEGLYKVLERMIISGVPFISIQPNAGMPVIEDGRLIYLETPEKMADFAVKYIQLGASIVGSCCGSTPEHTRAIRNAISNIDRVLTDKGNITAFTSKTKFIQIDRSLPVTVIGEKINSYTEDGKILVENKDVEGLIELGREQVRSGAKAVDVHLSLPGVDETPLLTELIYGFQQFGDVPLVFDIQDPEVLETALKLYPGRALVNSISLEPNKEKLIGLVKKYGALAVALTSGSANYPSTAEERIGNGEKFLSKLEPLGRSGIIFDPLVFPVSVYPESIKETLKAIEYFSNKGFPTIIGLSNVSFGLPKRTILNRSFLSMAVFSGVDSVILNPLDPDLMDTLIASQVLAGRIPLREYTRRFAPSH